MNYSRLRAQYLFLMRLNLSALGKWAMEWKSLSDIQLGRNLQCGELCWRILFSIWPMLVRNLKDGRAKTL